MIDYSFDVSNKDAILNELKINNNHLNYVFIKMKKENKIDNNNFFISKEIDEIRSFIYSKLFDQYDNIEVKPKISFKQLFSLIKYKKEKYFKIINCD